MYVYQLSTFFDHMVFSELNSRAVPHRLAGAQVSPARPRPVVAGTTARAQLISGFRLTKTSRLSILSSNVLIERAHRIAKTNAPMKTLLPP